MLFTGNEKTQNKESEVTNFDLRSALESENYHLHKFLGVNRDKANKKISIRIWAPNLKAVSLISDFNNWSKTANLMNRIEDSDIWSIELPERDKGFAYQFALHQLNDEIKIINDPFATNTSSEGRHASYYSEEKFEWQDQDWIKKRESTDLNDKTVIIKALDIEIIHNPEINSFQSIANYIVEQAKQERFTHIELSNFFETIIDLAYSSQINFNKEPLFFSPTSALGELDDFKCFVNCLHKNNIGIVLKLPYFANEIMSNYGAYKTLQKPIHQNFYFSNIIFWLEEVHIDGFNLGPLEQVLIKGKEKNQLFIREMNKIIHKRSNGVFSIAQETNCFCLLTKSNHDNSLGFDYKLNVVWLRQILDILKSKNKNLENFAANLSSENFLLGFVKDFDITGLNESDFKILLSLAFLCPGKKYFIDGMLDDVFYKFKNLSDFYFKLSKLYENEEILSKTDLLSERFCITDIQKNIVVFKRWSQDFSETVTTVVNFANTSKQSFQIDVPKAGFYREVYNSSSSNQKSSLSNDDGIYTYSNQNSLSNKSIVIDLPAKTVLCYKFST